MRTALKTSAFLLLAWTSPGWSQSPAPLEPTGLQLSRAELQDLLEKYEATINSSEYSGALRERARDEAKLIRSRLEEGDLQVGDRIMLTVEGHQELTDTFVVTAGRVVVIPSLGTVALAGVLRSELEPYFREQVSRYVVNPMVHARSLVRIEIIGAVQRPGYYTLPSDLLLGDALMLAGGPLHNAALQKLQIRRGDQAIWSGEALREAMAEGRTLDQLSLRAGDEIRVPEKNTRLANIRNGVLGLSSLVLVLDRLGVL